jgi:CubicO group peptidase (beta-lactamase class C family)
VNKIHLSIRLNVNIILFVKNITVGDVLSHRPGLPYVDEQLTINDVCNWSRMTSLLAAQKPHWEPGTNHGYHPIATGFIGGELVRRVDPHHRSYGQFIRDEIDSEFYMGVSNDKLEARMRNFEQSHISFIFIL